MFEAAFSATLVSDVVITADGATAGGHEGLDYLPGSLFLGAAASAAVEESGRFDPAFFLSGRVRFLDGLPLVDGAQAWPFPLCFHRIKGERWQDHPPLNMLARDEA